MIYLYVVLLLYNIYTVYDTNRCIFYYSVETTIYPIKLLVV